MAPELLRQPQVRILVLSNYFPEHRGGIEFVALNLVKRLRALHEVHWLACDVAPGWHTTEAGDVPLSATNFAEQHLGFPYPVPTPGSLGDIRDQVAWCDVVHLHDCLYFANVIAFRESRLLKKPCLVTQHVGLGEYLDPMRRGLQRLAYAVLGRMILQSAERVVFISGRVRNWFGTWVQFRQPPGLVPNGVDRAWFRIPTAEERAQARTALGLPPRASVCLFVGNFTKKKGYHIVQEVAGMHTEVHWLAIGKGELGTGNRSLSNVRAIEPLPQDALRQYYWSADILVQPSVGEGFPLVVQEALACGLPAAVSDQTASTVPDAPLINLDVSSAAAVDETLRGLLASPARLADLRTRSADFARIWDWDKVASQYEKILQELVQGNA